MFALLLLHCSMNRLVALLTLFFVSSCSKPQEPEYRGFNNLRVEHAGAKESVVSANIKFYNPNNFPLQLKKADVFFLLNDKQAAHCNIDSTINIPKLDSFYVPVSFKVSFGNILNNAFQLLLNGKAKINAEGFVKFKRAGVAFKVPVHYEAYQDLDSLFQSIQ